MRAPLPGSALRSGETVAASVGSEAPRMTYSLNATRGQIFNLEMTRISGNLDPYLVVLDADGNTVLENDDASADTRNAAIRDWLVPDDAVYTVVATRYGEEAGDSSGSFVLRLSEGEGSGLGNNALAPALLQADTPVTGTISNEQTRQYFQFTAQADDLVSVTMDRASGTLDAFLTLANAGLQPLVTNDDGGSGQNSRIDDFRIPTSGVYVIIAGRFSDEQTQPTQGDYVLQWRSEGSAFAGIEASIPRLVYGTTVDDTINDADPRFALRVLRHPERASLHRHGAHRRQPGCGAGTARQQRRTAGAGRRYRRRAERAHRWVHAAVHRGVHDTGRALQCRPRRCEHERQLSAHALAHRRRAATGHRRALKRRGCYHCNNHVRQTCAVGAAPRGRLSFM